MGGVHCDMPLVARSCCQGYGEKDRAGGDRPCAHLPMSDKADVSLPCHRPPTSVFRSWRRSMMLP